MKETKVCCDHCGKVIDSMTSWVDDEILVAAERIECDLCSDCMGDLIKIIADFCTNATVAKGA